MAYQFEIVSDEERIIKYTLKDGYSPLKMKSRNLLAYIVKLTKVCNYNTTTLNTIILHLVVDLTRSS